MPKTDNEQRRQALNAQLSVIIDQCHAALASLDTKFFANIDTNLLLINKGVLNCSIIIQHHKGA